MARLSSILLASTHGVEVAPSFDWRSAEELQPALAVLAPSPEVLNALARYNALRGRTALGSLLVTRAIASKSDCEDCYDTYALILFRQCDADAAVRAQTTAINLNGEDRWPAAMAERLEIYREAVAKAGADVTIGGK